MDNADNIVGYLKRFVDVTNEEAAIFNNHFKETKVKKGQFIIQPEFTAKYRNYILQGSFRAYIIDEKGNDHTISFAIDDWWITDINSYIYQQPATMFVVAMEDSLILQLDYEKEKELKAGNHKYESFSGRWQKEASLFCNAELLPI
jgi:CRP-like cAMP-binding protein